MNKTEQAVLRSMKENLGKVVIVQTDDNWEIFGNRMRTTCRNTITLLNQLLELEPTKDEEADDKITL